MCRKGIACSRRQLQGGCTFPAIGFWRRTLVQQENVVESWLFPGSQPVNGSTAGECHESDRVPEGSRFGCRGRLLCESRIFRPVKGHGMSFPGNSRGLRNRDVRAPRDREFLLREYLGVGSAVTLHGPVMSVVRLVYGCAMH